MLFNYFLNKKKKYIIPSWLVLLVSQFHSIMKWPTTSTKSKKIANLYSVAKFKPVTLTVIIILRILFVIVITAYSVLFYLVLIVIVVVYV